MSFKILYAASNRAGSKLQLFRLLQHIKDYNIEIKIAGYRNLGIYLDWCLDALNDIVHPEIFSYDNVNLDVYYEQIKTYSPDLIISDLEPYTSYVARSLEITHWQVSPLLLYLAENRQYSNECVKNLYTAALNKLQKQQYIDAITYSNKNFVYSFVCDFPKRPNLKEDFIWLRPYHYLGQKSKPCEHDLIIVNHKQDKKIESLNKNDTVIFSDQMPNTKYLYNTDEYVCNVKNAKNCVSRGLTDVIADFLYNGKYPIIIPDLLELEVALNVFYMERYEIGNVSYDGKIDATPKEINIQQNKNIYFLHQYIEELIY